jgi:hypothetical protein
MRASTFVLVAGFVAPLMALALPQFGGPLSVQLLRREAVPGNGPTVGHRACDIKAIALPTSAQGLPEPKSHLLLVSIGFGTQNYTCASADAEPVLIGALAKLTNATCQIANGDTDSANKGSPYIGEHYFLDSKSPDFHIPSLGNVVVNKTAAVNATHPDKDVPYLKLETIPTRSHGAIQEVYRLETCGGVAPKSCKDQKLNTVIPVQYRAQYWLYGVDPDTLVGGSQV